MINEEREGKGEEEEEKGEVGKFGGTKQDNV